MLYPELPSLLSNTKLNVITIICILQQNICVGTILKITPNKCTVLEDILFNFKW